MTNRRELLQIGFAASTLPLATQAARAAGIEIGADRIEPLTIYKAVYDSRFPASVAFARRVAALGVPSHAIEGDMTRFWYDDLYHRWKQGPIAIAGLTAHGPMFCLERLAWDQRMRVVFRAEHKPNGDSSIEHDLSGPVAMLDDACGAVAHSNWSERMADLVTQCPRGRVEITTSATTSRAGRGVLHGEESLYSWVIAPAHRA
jgi:hypothetical protein